MINVSNEVQQKISNGNALTHAKIVIDDRVFGYDNKDNTQTPADDGSIYKLDIQYDISQNEFALGTACIQTCEVMLYGTSDFEFEGKYFKVYIGYELDEKFTANGAEYPKIEWVPMGVFFTTEIVKKGDWTSFVGYDRTYKYTDMVYVPSSSLGSKPSVYDVFMDIFKFTGAPYDAASFENLMSAKVDMSLLYGSDSDGNTTGYTVRDALGFLSGKVGGCIIVDRYDKFKFLDYSFATTYTEAEGGFLFEQPYLITDDDITDAQISGDGIHGMRYIDVMTSNAAVRYDNGNTDYKNGIVLDSPIITTENEAMAVLDHINDLYAWKGGIFYMTPCSFKLLNGDVTLELGDIISYVPKDTYALGEQSYIPIMHMGINYTGKPEIDISAYNQTQTQQENRTGPLSRSFTAFKRAADNKYKYLDEALEIVSSQITGADGGYIVVDKNEDGTWRQIRVLDSIENPQTAIVINKNGIGFSQDGGQSMNSAALTIDGKFVANSLTGAILQAAQGYIGGWKISTAKICGGNTDIGEKTAVMQLPPTSAGGRSIVFAAGGSNHDNYSDCPFRVDYKGNLYSTSGKIAGWEITNDALYADYGNYRTYIQKPTSEDSWVFSTQMKSGSGYYGTFFVTASGEAQFAKEVKFKHHIEIAAGAVINGGINVIGGASIDVLKATVSATVKRLYLGYGASSGILPVGVNTSGEVVAVTSSKRYKENITEELNDELKPEKLYDLPVKQYNYKPEYSDIELVAGTQIGIIAEDVEKYYPNALIRNNEGEAESWQDRIMIPAMLKLIQQQKKQIDELSEKLTKIEKTLENKN